MNVGLIGRIGPKYARFSELRRSPLLVARQGDKRLSAATATAYRVAMDQIEDLPTGPAGATITPIHVADLAIEGETMPVCVHLIEHPAGRVLVDTGLTELHPAVADMDPRVIPLDLDASGSIDAVVNTHLHFDHVGGNHLFPGIPIHVQRRELDDARTAPDYTIPAWVDPPGVRYIEHDGAHELLPGVRLLPAPGHTPGSQIVVVDTAEGPVVIAGDTAVWFGELDEPTTEGQRLIRSLNPVAVWLSHTHEPWRPPSAQLAAEPS